MKKILVLFLAFVIYQLAVVADSTFELGEIVVNESKTDVNSVNLNVSVITEEDLKDYNIQTISEALDYVSAVDIKTGGKNQSYLYMRGFEQSSIKVFIDGVPAKEAYYGLIDLSQFPVENISKIVVSKGPVSVIYGANTMGGIINIITKQGSNKNKTYFSTITGTNFEHNYFASNSGSFKKFNYYASFNFKQSDGFRLSSDFDKDNANYGINSVFREDGGNRNNSDYIKRVFNFNLGYTFDKTSKLNLFFNSIKNQKGCGIEQGGKKPLPRYWYFTEWEQWHLGLAGEKIFNNNIKLKYRTYYIKHDDELTDVTPVTETSAVNWFSKSAFDDYTLGSEIQTILNTNNFGIFNLAFNYTKDNNKQKEIAFGGNVWEDMGTFEAQTYSFGIENIYEISEKFSVVSGISFDYFDPEQSDTSQATSNPENVDAVNPQINLNYFINSSSKLSFSVGKKTKFPQLKELYSKHVGGNPELKPEKTVSYDLSYSNKLTSKLKFSLSYFYNDVDDLIDQNSSKEYINIGESKIYGIESNFNYNILKNIVTNLNYTYLSAKDKKTNEKLDDRPKHKLNLDLNIYLPYQINCNLRLSYTGEQINNGSELGGYTLTDLNIRKKFDHSNSNIFVTLKNLTDKNYYDGNGPQPGREILTGLDISF